MKVFIVKGSATMLNELRSMLSAIPGVAIVGLAVDESSAIKRINALCPDVVTLAIRLQSGSGLGVLENIRKHHAGIKVMVLTNCYEKAYVDRCIRLGADYFFDKFFQYTQFCDALRNLAHLERIANKPGALQIPEKLPAASSSASVAIGNS